MEVRSGALSGHSHGGDRLPGGKRGTALAEAPAGRAPRRADSQPRAAPRPSEQDQAAAGQQGHAWDARAVPMALLIPFFTMLSARCSVFPSRWAEAFISPGTLISR